MALTAAVSAANGVTRVVLTFAGAGVEFGSLADGNYQLTVRGDRVYNGDGLLDGDGDGQAGGDSVAQLYRRFGDLDGNGVVDFLDFARFRQALGDPAAYDPMFDFDGNGNVDFLDFTQFRARLGT